MSWLAANGVWLVSVRTARILHLTQKSFQIALKLIEHRRKCRVVVSGDSYALAETLKLRPVGIHQAFHALAAKFLQTCGQVGECHMSAIFFETLHQLTKRQ